MTDKLLPQAVDLETHIISTVMEYPEQLNDIRDILSPECFYLDKNKVIYESILKLDDDNIGIDLIMVINKLKEKKQLDYIGGELYLIEISGKYSGGDIQSKAMIVKQQYMRREIIRMSNEAMTKAYDTGHDVFDIISTVSSRQDSLLGENITGIHHIGDCIKDVYTVIDKNMTGGLTGLLTGFTEYDEFSRGDQDGDLIVVAGETSQGKTAWALCKAFNQAILGYKVAVFSYEMSKNQITARLMALATELSAKQILMDKLNPTQYDQINVKIRELLDTNIYIVEVLQNDFDWLKAQIKVLKVKYDIQSVIIDYAQLITINGLPRNQQVSNVANGLKFLAKHKNINIPITLLSQLARSTEPKPSLSRLKESGDIENAADTVIGIWRPHHYQIENIRVRTGEGIYEEISTQHIGIAHILKGRNIGLKDIVMNWNAKLTRFSDYVPYQDTNPF